MEHVTLEAVIASMDSSAILVKVKLLFSQSALPCIIFLFKKKSVQLTKLAVGMEHAIMNLAFVNAIKDFLV